MKYIAGKLQFSPDAQREFDLETRPFVEKLVKDAGYDGAAWSMTVIEAHKFGASRRPAHLVVRMGAVLDVSYQFELTVRPTTGQNHFILRISIPRSQAFNEVCNAVAIAINQYKDRVNTEIAASPPAPAPAAPKASDLLVSGITRLEGLRTSLDSVLSIARDARASVEMRDEIQTRHDAAAELARPLLAELEQAEGLMKSHDRRVGILSEDLQKTCERVRAIEKSLAEAQAELGEAKAAWERAAAAAEPFGKAWDDAAADLAEADRLEAERIKTINETPGIAGLLAALETLNGSK